MLSKIQLVGRKQVCVLQAKSWLGWEFAASSGRTEHLQWWDGSSWQQSSFPSSSSQQTPPAGAMNGSQNGQSGPKSNSHAANGSANGNSPVASAPSSSSGPAAATPADTAAPAAMSSFTAQAMLECHYSKHQAFMQDTPLLQVCSPLCGTTLSHCFWGSSPCQS